MCSMKWPKLSYVLLSHNREKYIRAAIESAFNQIYEGELEYIISDDCSTDRTYEIINECVAAYKGSRRVVVTQTPHNMHLAGNTNHALQFVTGDYVVRADDDDLSTNVRCMLVGQAIMETPGCSWVVTKQKRFTDPEEPEIRKEYEMKQKDSSFAVVFDVARGFGGKCDLLEGEVTAKVWRTDVYRAFRPLPLDGYWIDDVICRYRANALGSCVYIPEVTVLTRVGIGNMSGVGTPKAFDYQSIINHEKFVDKYFNTTYCPLKEAVEEVKLYMKKNRFTAYLAAKSYFDFLEEEVRKVNVWRSYWRKGTLNRLRIRREMKCKGLFSLLRCLPMPLFAALLSAYRCLVKFVKP